MKHLIDIKSMDKSEIAQIISFARTFKLGKRKPSVSGKTACLMFFENSTRTKASFELAAQKLGMNVLNFDCSTSSLSKGETIRDTIENLYAIGVNNLIVRTSDNNFFQRYRDEVKVPVSFINAGAGESAHPTQALLDFLTMLEKLATVKNKKICIIGDVAHSRVARSNIELLTRYYADVHVVAPEYFMPDDKRDDVTYHTNLIDGIRDASVIMALRIQKERFDELDGCDIEHFIENYQLNSELIQEYCEHAILLHPGPVNRDVEITSELLDSHKGRTILEQAQNGTYIRMAVLEMLNLRGTN